MNGDAGAAPAFQGGTFQGSGDQSGSQQFGGQQQSFQPSYGQQTQPQQFQQPSQQQQVDPQQLQQSLQGYQQLGSLEDVQNAILVAKMLEEQPQRVYEILREQYGQQNIQPPQQPVLNYPPQYPMQPGSNGLMQQGYGSVPSQPQMYQPQQYPAVHSVPAYQQPQQYQNPYQSQMPSDPRMDRHEKLLEGIGNWVVEMHKKNQAAEEDAKVQATLKGLAAKYGPIDPSAEDYIVMQLQHGIDPEQAINNWNGAVQRHINNMGGGPKPQKKGLLESFGINFSGNSQQSPNQQMPQQIQQPPQQPQVQQPTPPILGGGGSLPSSEPKSIADLTNGQTQKLVAGILAKTQQEGR